MDNQSCEVLFLPDKVKIEVPKYTTVLEAALQNNLPLEGPCNGRGKCGKCLINVSGELSKASREERVLLGSKIAEGWRLACRCKILGQVRVFLGEKYFLQTILKGQTVNYKFDPPIEATPGRREKIFGVAVDIGTTSIVASIAELENGGKVVDTAACLNPQVRYGGDVLTRISFAQGNVKNLQKLKESVVSGINQLIAGFCDSQGIETGSIVHVTIAANTTMMHLLAGVDPSTLARAPYQPVFVNYRQMQAEELDLKVAPAAAVSLLPSVSAFVGSDILAGIIATDFHKQTVPSLFVDIGTNGEIVANVGGRLVATSAAAGPAFEGMNIQCGCRAENGAISSVKINEQGEVLTEVIGNAKKKGLCGSGLVELTAELMKAGVILPSGRFTGSAAALPPALAQRFVNYHVQTAFVVDFESMIVLTQKDIRQVQLAKAAVATAIELLLKRLQIDLNKVEQIYIAGSFGYHLKPEALKTIGLLPPGLDAEVKFVGNTAKEGALLCLTSKMALREIIALQKRVNPLELSYVPEFQEHFVRQMAF